MNAIPDSSPSNPSTTSPPSAPHISPDTGAVMPSSPGSAPAPPAEKPASVLVIYAFPSVAAGHGPRLLETVKKTLTEVHAPFEIVDLYRIGFNPILTESEAAEYGTSIAVDVEEQQKLLKAHDSWIILCPVWWSSPPAILKGYFERVLTPGFAFGADKDHAPLLNTKRALVVRTFATSAAHEQKIGHIANGLMEKAILGHCGVWTVSVDIYSIQTLAETAFNHALFQLAGATRRMVFRPGGVPHHLRTVPAPYLPPIEQKDRHLPELTADAEEKPELSEEAKADLEYFKSARMAARKAVHQRAESRLGGGRGGGRASFAGEGGFGGGRRRGRGRGRGRGRRGEGGFGGSTGGAPGSGGSGAPGSGSGAAGGRSGGFRGSINYSGRQPGDGSQGGGDGFGGGRRRRRRRGGRGRGGGGMGGNPPVGGGGI